MNYSDRNHGPTRRVAKCIPTDKIEWTYLEGKFTFGDTIRHLGAMERYMFAECVTGNPSRYDSCGREIAEGYEETMEYYEARQAESMKIFCGLSDKDMESKCRTPDSAPIFV